MGLNKQYELRTRALNHYSQRCQGGSIILKMLRRDEGF